MNAKTSRKFWLVYLALFTALFLLVTLWFWSSGRSLCWEHDGLTQHYKAAVWYGEYLRSGLKALAKGQTPAFSHFNVSVGEGADVFQAFHYYVLGDPFALFTIFFTRSSMYLYFYLSVFLRLLCAGAVFILFIWETFSNRDLSKGALLAGALCYAFCDWALYNLDRHIFFLNPLIYLPLLLWGTERIVKKKSLTVYTLAVCVSALSNFYFFYMLVLAEVLYVIIRWTALLRKNKKEAAASFLKLAACSLLGVAMASAVLVPVLNVFLQDERMASGISLNLFYSMKYYMRLPSFLIKPGNVYWTRIGTSTPVLLGGILYVQTGEWKKKSSRSINACILTVLIILLVPAFGQIFNGFSYQSNRWTWAFALMSATVFTLMWDRFFSLTKKEWEILALSFLIYLLITSLATYRFDSREDFYCVPAAGAVGVCFLLVLPLLYKRKKAVVLSCMAVAFLGVLLMAAFLYSPFGANYASASLKIKELEKSIRRSQGGAAAQAAADVGYEGFYRFSGEETFSEWNTALLNGNSTTAYYWSIADPYRAEYIDFLRIGEDFAFQTYGYHLKTIPTTLSGVRYFVTSQKDDGAVPYGFSFLETVDMGNKNKEKKKDLYQVYQNDNALSAITTYDSYILKEDAEDLSAPGRQMAMLESAVCDVPIERLSRGKVEDCCISREYALETVGKKVTVQKGQISVGKKESGIRLSFETVPGCEPYLIIDNLRYQPLTEKGSVPSKVELSVTACGQERLITHNNPSTRYYRGVHDYALCLANRSEMLHEAEIRFSNAGIYNYDDMKILYLPMDRYPELTRERMAETEDAELSLGRDEITAKISLEKEKLLCFAFPYSEGWKALVDGKEATLYRVNLKNMGVMLPVGEHEVRLVYHTPFSAAGAILSLLGWLVFAGMLLTKIRIFRKIKKS